VAGPLCLLSIQRRNGKRLDPGAVAEAILKSAAPRDPRKTPECPRYLAGTLNIPGAYALINKGGKKTMSNPDASLVTPQTAEPGTVPAQTSAVAPSEAGVAVDPPNAPFNPGDRGGSHNLVIGAGHRFTEAAFGGLVAGRGNTISNTAASVSGGFDNIASGELASVSGGFENVASGRTNGPGVLIMHELPGVTPQCIDLATRVVDVGFTRLSRRRKCQTSR
jgi:hypothetical protein